MVWWSSKAFTREFPELMPSSRQKYGAEKCCCELILPSFFGMHYKSMIRNVLKSCQCEFLAASISIVPRQLIGWEEKCLCGIVVQARNISLNFWSISLLGPCRDSVFPSQQENRLRLHLHLVIWPIFYPQ